VNLTDPYREALSAEGSRDLLPGPPRDVQVSSRFDAPASRPPRGVATEAPPCAPDQGPGLTTELQRGHERDIPHPGETHSTECDNVTALDSRSDWYDPKMDAQPGQGQGCLSSEYQGSPDGAVAFGRAKPTSLVAVPIRRSLNEVGRTW